MDSTNGSNENDSGVVSGAHSAEYVSLGDQSISDDGGAANGKHTQDWQPIIDRALCFYNSTTVSDILDKCFQQEFSDSGLDIPARSHLKDAGTILHEYIERFYKKFNNRAMDTAAATHDYVRRMLTALESKPEQRIKWDRLVDGSDPESEKIHVNLWRELIQFYKFVNENHMVLADFEQQIFDPRHLIRGRVNAVFRLNGSNDELILYDWTRSTIMGPGSLSLRRKTLQLNIYKYILERFYDKSIATMRSVIFHEDKDNYEIIEIEDIDFHCKCASC